MDLVYRTRITSYDPRRYHAGQRENQFLRTLYRENTARYR